MTAQHFAEAVTQFMTGYVLRDQSLCEHRWVTEVRQLDECWVLGGKPEEVAEVECRTHRESECCLAAAAVFCARCSRPAAEVTG